MSAIDECDTVQQIKRATESLRDRRGLIGIACCPLVECAIRQREAHEREKAQSSFGLWFNPVPRLVDPRLSSGRSEFYYDEEAWRERCAEQRKWDAGHIRTT